MKLKHSPTFILSIILILLFVAWAELDLYAPAMVEMMRAFHTDEIHIQWTLSLNFFGFFISSLIFGPLADTFGCRKSILIGSFIFIVGSLLCCLSQSINIMILGRLIQGLGISAIVVLLADIYKGNKRLKIFALIGSMVCIVMALAPIIGVFLTKEFGWRSNFWSILYSSIFGTTLIFLFLPETRPKNTLKPFSINIIFHSYKQVITDKKFLQYFLSLCLLIAPYWIFIGLIPLFLWTSLVFP